MIDIIILVQKIAEWCNGSTADSDSVSGGSNPSSVADKPIAYAVGFFNIYESSPARSLP